MTGIEQNKKEVETKLIEKGFSIDEIEEITKLTKEQIEELKYEAIYKANQESINSIKLQIKVLQEQQKQEELTAEELEAKEIDAIRKLMKERRD